MCLVSGGGAGRGGEGSACRLGVLVVDFAAPPAEHADNRAGGRNRHSDVRRDLLGGHLSEALLEESIALHPALPVAKRERTIR